jgi:hypothetical protein
MNEGKKNKDNDVINIEGGIKNNNAPGAALLNLNQGDT